MISTFVKVFSALSISYRSSPFVGENSTNVQRSGIHDEHGGFAKAACAAMLTQSGFAIPDDRL